MQLQIKKEIFINTVVEYVVKTLTWFSIACLALCALFGIMKTNLIRCLQILQILNLFSIVWFIVFGWCLEPGILAGRIRPSNARICMYINGVAHAPAVVSCLLFFNIQPLEALAVIGCSGCVVGLAYCASQVMQITQGHMFILSILSLAAMFLIIGSYLFSFFGIYVFSMRIHMIIGVLILAIAIFLLTAYLQLVTNIHHLEQANEYKIDVLAISMATSISSLIIVIFKEILFLYGATKKR